MKKGYTFVETFIVVTIIILVFLTVIIKTKPIQNLAKGRDNKRLSDMNTLDRAVTEYFEDNGAYPGTNNLIYVSTSPSTSGIAIQNANNGWIPSDLSKYTSKLPTDPKNDNQYFYTYKHNAKSYEIDCKLEYLSDGANDGGSSNLYYELGNNLQLITP